MQACGKQAHGASCKAIAALLGLKPALSMLANMVSIPMEGTSQHLAVIITSCSMPLKLMLPHALLLGLHSQHQGQP